MPQKPKRPRFQPHLENLEERCVPAVFTVVSADDEGTGSLRQAILDANDTAGHDVIRFRLADDSLTITPLAALPTLTEAVTIDGTSQPGYAGKPLVFLDGISAGEHATGLVFIGGHSTVRGLGMTRFFTAIHLKTGGTNVVAGMVLGTDNEGSGELGNGNGVLVDDSANNRIGGTSFRDRNVISGNRGRGVIVTGAGSTGNAILGNYIGVDPTGKSSVSVGDTVGVDLVNQSAHTTVGGTTVGARNVIAGVGHGIVVGDSKQNLIQGNYIGTDVTGTQALGGMIHGLRLANGAENQIGGTTPGAGNVISGSDGEGVYVESAGSFDNVFQGNLIGTDATGTVALGNRDGIHIGVGAHHNLIGGTSGGAGNVISGNVNSGVLLSAFYGPKAHHNVVQGNRIGAPQSGPGILANGAVGVSIDNAYDNLVGGVGGANTIRGGRAGVAVAGAEAQHNRIQHNTITGVTGLPIDLGEEGPTPNDGGDRDTGPNQLQNSPLLERAGVVRDQLTVRGLLVSKPQTSYTIDFYTATAAGEPKRFLGSSAAQTNILGTVRFEANLAGTVGVGERIVATATDAAGNTSELSLPQSVESSFLRARSLGGDEPEFHNPQLRVPVKNGGEHGHYMQLPLPGLQVGDRVRLAVTIHYPDPEELYRAFVYAVGMVDPEGGNVVVVGNESHPRSLTMSDEGVVSVAGDHNLGLSLLTVYSTQLDIPLYNSFARDGWFSVTLWIERRNLTALAPGRSASGDLTFGYKVKGTVPPTPEPVQARLYYAAQVAGGGWDLKTVLAGNDIKTADGSTETFTLRNRDLPAPPPGTTHLVTRVDHKNQVDEGPLEDDNLLATPLGSVLPNITVKAPVRRADGGIDFGYSIGALALPSTNGVEVDLYYARGATPADVMEFDNLYSVQLLQAANTNRTITVPPPSPGRLPHAVPPGATHLIALVDRHNHIAETNETGPDNFQVVELAKFLPNYVPTSAELDDSGKLEVTYKVLGGASGNSTPRLGVFWARGATVADIIGKVGDQLPPPAFSKVMQTTPGKDVTFAVPAARLINPPSGTTHLVILTDYRGDVEEWREDDNVLATAFSTLAKVKGDLEAYRPQEVTLSRLNATVPEDEEDTKGVGIRLNGDDDNDNQQADREEVFIGVPKEDDLIRVDFTVSRRKLSDGVRFKLQRDTPALRVWLDKEKQQPLLTDVVQEFLPVVNGKVTVWVEWAGVQHGTGTLKVLATDVLEGQRKELDSLRFETFRSNVIVFTGENSLLGENVRPNARRHGMIFGVAKPLYLAGYDVHCFGPNDGLYRDFVSHQAPAAVEAFESIGLRGVTQLAMMGHSHGGGAAMDLATFLNAEGDHLGAFTIPYIATVDALYNNLSSVGTAPVFIRPPGVGYLANFYQTNRFSVGSLVLLAGVNIPGADVNVRIEDEDHQSIDSSTIVHNRILKRMTDPAIGVFKQR